MIFMDFKNPKILTSVFKHRELLNEETISIQEQQPEITQMIFHACNILIYRYPRYLFV